MRVVCCQFGEKMIASAVNVCTARGGGSSRCTRRKTPFCAELLFSIGPYLGHSCDVHLQVQHELVVQFGQQDAWLGGFLFTKLSCSNRPKIC